MYVYEGATNMCEIIRTNLVKLQNCHIDPFAGFDRK